MLTSAILSGLAASILSLILEYVPFVGSWYQSLNPGNKRSVMGLLIVLVAISAYLLSCYTDIGAFACGQTGFFSAIEVIFVSLMTGIASNQSVHSLTKKTSTNTNS